MFVYIQCVHKLCGRLGGGGRQFVSPCHPAIYSPNSSKWCPRVGRQQVPILSKRKKKNHQHHHHKLSDQKRFSFLFEILRILLVSYLVIYIFTIGYICRLFLFFRNTRMLVWSFWIGPYNLRLAGRRLQNMTQKSVLILILSFLVHTYLITCSLTP